MRKYLEYFPGDFDATVADKIKVENKPYVGFSKTQGVNFTITPQKSEDDDVIDTTFYIESCEDGNEIQFTSMYLLGKNASHIQYSTDNKTYEQLVVGSSILLNTNERLYLKGDGTNLQKTDTKSAISKRKLFNVTKSFNLGGDLKQFLNPNDDMRDGGYFANFKGMKVVDASKLLLPSRLADACYRSMFENCASLIKAPALPATELASNCYWNMFYGCTSLISAPELPATTLDVGCYNNMFSGCTSLVTAPELPATILTDYCYECMFYNCSSLIEAPELHATELPYLCYYEMFYGCTNLKRVTCLALSFGDSCTTAWLAYTYYNGTFVKHPEMASWTTGNSGIPAGWTVEDAVL